ncbi:MAG: transglutaminase domain-containing protein [Anaerolineaceae bacterium]|nr:transglutaminase domain-containing protein [Anaerolineaceae bacterium]
MKTQEQENLDSIEKPKKKKKKGIFARRKTQRWSARVIVAVLALSFILISLYWIPANLTYRVQETFSISATESTDVSLVVFLPTSGATQTLTELDFEWPGTWQVETIGRIDLLRLIGEVQAGETLTADVTYWVDMVSGDASWVGEPVLPEELLPSDGIPADAPEITAQVESLMVDDDAPATTRVIYDTVAAQEDITDRSARANLIATLNRAAQIPTRVVTGWVLPDLVPLFSHRLTDETGLQRWNEVFLQEAWQLEDASCCRWFPRQRLLGWTEGRHLVLDEVGNLDAVVQSLADEAGQANWQSVSLSSPVYVAWSQDANSLEIAAEMKVQKTWDGRWAMAIAVVTILVVLEKMMETDHFTKKSKRKPPGYEI